LSVVVFIWLLKQVITSNFIMHFKIFHLCFQSCFNRIKCNKCYNEAQTDNITYITCYDFNNVLNYDLHKLIGFNIIHSKRKKYIYTKDNYFYQHDDDYWCTSISDEDISNTYKTWKNYYFFALMLNSRAIEFAN